MSYDYSERYLQTEKNKNDSILKADFRWRIFGHAR